MREQPQIEIPVEPPERGPSRFAFVVAAAAVLIVIAALYLWTGRRSPSGGGPQAAHLPFGAAEVAYAPKIQIENLGLSRAENFLNQEVTILGGEFVNSGEQTVRGIELTVEFIDTMNQVALRESRAALSSASGPLAPGERRTFDISFEHIPTSWNMQMPAVRISGLLLTPVAKETKTACGPRR